MWLLVGNTGSCSFPIINCFTWVGQKTAKAQQCAEPATHVGEFTGIPTHKPSLASLAGHERGLHSFAVWRYGHLCSNALDH